MSSSNTHNSVTDFPATETMPSSHMEINMPSFLIIMRQTLTMNPTSLKNVCETEVGQFQDLGDCLASNLSSQSFHSQSGKIEITFT